MKKFRNFMMIIGMIAVMAAVFSISAYAAETDKCGKNATYTLSDGVLTISGKGAVSEDFFSGRTDIETVIIEEGIEEIGLTAFAESSVQEVTFPQSLKLLESESFRNCSGLKKITFLGRPGKILPNAFMNVTATVYVTDAWNDYYMQNYWGTLFYYGGWRSCGKNASFSLAADGTLTIKGTGTVRSVFGDAFKKNTKKVVIEDGITELEKACFKSFDRITEVTLPGSLKSAPNAFSGCEAITDVHFGEGMTELSTFMFHNCASLKTLTLPSTMKKIGAHAFESCFDLTEVKLPDGFETIEDGAFFSCWGLSSMDIPESVTQIGSKAFIYAADLKKVRFITDDPPAFGANAFFGCKYVKINVPIESSVKYESAIGLDSSKFEGIFSDMPAKTGEGYSLESTADFCAFLNSIANGTNYSGEKITLKCDVDMAGIDYALVWPDDQYKSAFAGTFDGEYHVVKNLTVQTSEHRGALFRTVSGGAVIHSLVFDNVNVTGAGDKKGFGALIGYGSGTVSVMNVNVLSGNVTGGNCVSGIIGEFGGDKLLTVSDCKNGASVTALESDAGGIVSSTANAEVSIMRSENSGKILSKAGHAGGIAGYLGDNKNDPKHTVSDCKNTGDIEAESGNAGGIIGGIRTDSHFHTVTGNDNTGRVTASGTESCAGGIIGFLEGGGEISKNMNGGDIKALGKDAGGIVGAVEDDTCVFDEDKNFNAVSANGRAGGIVGFIGSKNRDQQFTFTNCANKGEVTSDASSSGGIIGELSTDNTKHLISGNVNAGSITGAGRSGGIIGYMLGGGEILNNLNSGNVTDKKGNAGGIIGEVEDDSCRYPNCVNTGAITGTKHTGQICGWDGSKKKTVDMAGSAFGGGNVLLIAVLTAALIGAAVLTIVFVKRKKTKEGKSL